MKRISEEEKRNKSVTWENRNSEAKAVAESTTEPLGGLAEERRNSESQKGGHRKSTQDDVMMKKGSVERKKLLEERKYSDVENLMGYEKKYSMNIVRQIIEGFKSSSADLGDKASGIRISTNNQDRRILLKEILKKLGHPYVESEISELDLLDSDIETSSTRVTSSFHGPKSETKQDKGVIVAKPKTKTEPEWPKIKRDDPFEVLLEPESENDILVMCTLANGKTIKGEYNKLLSVYEIKEDLAKMLGVVPDRITLRQNGTEAEDWLPLLHFLQTKKRIVLFNLTTPVDFLDLTTCPRISKETKVKVISPNGDFKIINVTIESYAYVKPWYGGFVNKRTGQEYHIATTQTGPRNPEGPQRITRFTQTQRKQVTKCVDTTTDKSTQMWRTDYYIPSNSDKILKAKKYVTHDEMVSKAEKLKKIIFLQRKIRAWLKRKHTHQVLEYIQDQDEREEKEKIQKSQQVDMGKESALVGMAFPTTREDFYRLYSLVSEWWEAEYKNILATRVGAARKAAFCGLLNKKIALLSAIEKQRIKSKADAIAHKELLELEERSEPWIVKRPKGYLVLTDTPDRQRAREFKEMYSSYTRTDSSPVDRIDLLMQFKQFLFNCELPEITKDLIQLLEREVDLISIGVKNEHLVGLRKRIALLFMEFIKHPDVNPPSNGPTNRYLDTGKERSYLCHCCRKVVKSSSFMLHTRLTRFWMCTSCEWINIIGQKCLDLSPYKRLLDRIRVSEVSKRCKSSVTFLLQSPCLYFIVHVIWHGRSIISQSSDLPKFQLPRWKKSEDWAPWNCILLTEDEAAIHEKIEEVEKFYHYEFIQKVRCMHLLAKIHFAALIETEENLHYTGVWNAASDVGTFLHPNYSKQLAKLEDPFFRDPPRKAN